MFAVRLTPGFHIPLHSSAHYTTLDLFRRDVVRVAYNLLSSGHKQHPWPCNLFSIIHIHISAYVFVCVVAVVGRYPGKEENCNFMQKKMLHEILKIMWTIFDIFPEFSFLFMYFADDREVKKVKTTEEVKVKQEGKSVKCTKLNCISSFVRQVIKCQGWLTVKKVL